MYYWFESLRSDYRAIDLNPANDRCRAGIILLSLLLLSSILFGVAARANTG